MIYFFADNHYGVHPGKVIFEHLPEALRTRIVFREDDWDVLENSSWEKNCELLILDMIGDTCNIPHPNKQAEERVRTYLEKGGDVLLLHGSSAAFWQWDWWRELPGERWVRPGDPDNPDASFHSVRPYKLERSKTRHPLAAKLLEIELPQDEIYSRLENTCPCMRIMETTTLEGTFVQCCEAITPWGGKMLSFIPGHAPEVVAREDFMANVTTCLNYLLRGE